MDTTALSLCMDNGLPIHVFALEPGNVLRVVAGERVGTIISTPKERRRMIDELIQDATRRMDRSIEAAHEHFNTVRTGRASTALLDRIHVDYYGQPTPLKQLATINAPEPRMLTCSRSTRARSRPIERAIQESDLGLTPSNDGKLIRLPIPQLTEERRKELVKVVRQYAEEARVAVRNVRRDVIDDLKELEQRRRRPTRSIVPRSACRSSPTTT